MKKKVLQKIIVVLSVVSILACCFVTPAYATVFDYKDYVVAEDVSTENTQYQVSFPRNYWLKSSGSFNASGSTALYFPLTYYTDNVYKQKSEPIVFYPLGWQNYFAADNVINGSVFSCSIDCRLSLSKPLTNPYQVPYFVRLAFRFFDADYNLIGSILSASDPIFIMDSGFSRLTIKDTREILIEKPAGAVYCAPWFYIYQETNVLYPNSMDGTYVTFQVDSFDMYFNTSTDYLLQDALTKDNELKEEMIDQNQQMIDGTPQQNASVSNSNDAMSGAGDQLGDLTDQMEVEKPDAESIDVSIKNLIPETSVLAYTAPLLAIWNNDSLLAILIVVLTLVLVSWVMFGKK